MRQSKTVAAVLLFLLLLILTFRSEPAGAGTKDVLRAVSPAVVSVLAYDADDNRTAFGSGFIVRSDGLVVSNYHVVQGAHHVRVKLPGGDMYEVIGVVDVDGPRDYVILRIPGYGLPTAPMGNSEQVEVGDEVIAIGHPMGLEHTVSTGIVSQRRQFGSRKMLQNSVPISSGSSGGPLLNQRGEVVGITTSGMKEGQNLNFALPINYVLGALAANTAVRYSLADVVSAQERVDTEEARARFTKVVAVLRESDFSMAYPRQWRVERSEVWDEKRATTHRLVMLAPDGAAEAKVTGYLSEGIRIHLMYPPPGQVWNLDRAETWGPLHLKELLSLNPGFALTSSETITFAGQPAQRYSLIGQARHLSEPEKTTFIIVASPQYRLVVELVRPVSRLKEYDVIFEALLKTFVLAGPAGR